MFGMSKRIVLNDVDQDNVLKYHTKIVGILSENKDMNFKKLANLKRKIDHWHIS